MKVPVIDWIGEPVKKSVNSVFKGINEKVEAFDLFNKYRNVHFQMLKDVVGKVKILGMTSPISLADLYYPAQVSTDIRRRLYQPEWVANQEEYSKKNEARKARAVDASSYIEQKQRVVVLGGPGAGKTTFLKFLAVAYSNKNVFDSTKLKKSKLPFFLALPDLAKADEEIFDALTKNIVSREGEYAALFAKRSMEKGIAIILLDSLDEVPDARKGAIIDRIKRFTATFPDAKVVVSCRAADYKEVLESFDEVELVRLSIEAARKIVRSWFKEAPDRSDRLISVIDSDSSIANLTETPLLLSLLCIQFKHDLTLPRRKVEVYKRCVETLLREWDTTRGFRRETAYESLSDLHKERLFEHLAGEGTAKENVYVFHQEDIWGIAASYVERLGISKDEARNVVNEIERHHGIIERHSVESYCFSHSSIQDYFVAGNVIGKRIELDFIKRNIENDSVSSVIEFICGLHHDPVDIFDFMIKKISLKDLKNFPAIERRAKLLFLLYRCLSVGPTLSPPVVSKINSHIVSSLHAFVQLMGQNGVFPLCTFGDGGVRHPYFHVGQRRPSLHAALLPYRRLSNEIFSRPVESFVNEAFRSCDLMLNVKDDFKITDVSLILNTVVPLSRADPKRVTAILVGVKQRLKGQNVWLGRIADETISAINR